MKQHLILSVLASLLFFNLAAGSFVRVINAVENSAPMDVWVVRGDMQTLGMQQNTPPMGRLFQNLNYAQIPPYFFLVDSTEPWTFVINTQMQGTNSSVLTLQQIQSLPSFTATLLPNASYSLIIANPVQQTSGQNFEYLLLRDAVVTESQGTSTRLVNLIRSSAFLASDASQCADSMRSSVGYLRSSEYIALPSTSLENLVVCIDGQASFAFPASSFHDDKRAHSVFIFHLNQRTQIEIESGFQAQLFDVILEPRAGCPGEEATIEPQLSNPRFIREIPTTGVAAPLLVDDQPIVVNNVFLRSIHASPELPPVDVFLDGQLWFSSLSYANVTDYKSTIRGMHNVTVVPSSPLTSEQMQKLNVTFPYTFLTFLAWDSYYTLAILPTQTSNAGELVGPLHRLFIDSLCQQNAESGAAFVQFYNLAMNMGSVRVTGQAQQGQLTVSPLEDTTYSAFPTSSISTIGISTTQQQLQIQGRGVESLQANTLYTTFIIQQDSGEVAILVKDREIRTICSIVDAKAILSQL